MYAEHNTGKANAGNLWPAQSGWGNFAVVCLCIECVVASFLIQYLQTAHLG